LRIFFLVGLLAAYLYTIIQTTEMLFAACEPSRRRNNTEFGRLQQMGCFGAAAGNNEKAWEGPSQ
jgi:hypothetical protein